MQLGAIDNTGLAPQGLTLSDDGKRLFVYNFTNRSVAAYDISGIIENRDYSPVLLGRINTVNNEKLSSTVLKGKQIFYNARDIRMSQDGYISCASCHIDGGEDGRVWDFTERNEGFRNTITLIGYVEYLVIGIGMVNRSRHTPNADNTHITHNPFRPSLAKYGNFIAFFYTRC